MTIDNLKNYIASTFRGWRPSHFILECFLTALITYLATLITALSFVQIVLLIFLVFGTIAAAKAVLAERVRRWPSTYPDFLELQHCFAINRQTQAVGHAMQMISGFIEGMPKRVDTAENQERFALWRDRVHGYLAGTCNQRVVVGFDGSSASDPMAAMLYLNGLVNNLTQADLRSKPDEAEWQPIGSSKGPN